MLPTPLRWLAARLGRWGSARLEVVLGDLEESYHDDAAYHGSFRATRRYLADLVVSLFHFARRGLLTSLPMLFHYLKVAGRMLGRHKGFTVINVVGLAVSMAVCLLIVLFLRQQRQVDRFHEHADRLYRVVADAIDPDSNVVPVGATPAPLAEVLTQDVPGLEATVRLRELKAMAEGGGKTLGIRGFYVDPSFFEVFSFPLAAGDPQAVLTTPDALVLTASTAERFFGTADPIGEVLAFEDGRTFTVAGVLDVPPGPSHLTFDVLGSMQAVAAWPDDRAMLDDWHNFYSYYTYLIVRDEATVGRLRDVLGGLVARQYPPEEASHYAFGLQAVTAINLGEIRNNEVGFVLPGIVAYFLVALAGLILLVAAFNYVGLSVARALPRAREIGVRKVVGAGRGQLIRQFLGEAVLVAVAALALAGAVLVWLVPAFNELWFVQMAGAELRVDWLGDAGLYAVLLSFAILTGVVAGWYPAVVLSGFQPVQVLRRGRGQGRSGTRLRKTLVVAQFAFSTLLVVTLAVLVRQLDHMVEADYGIAAEGVVTVPLHDVPYGAFRQALLQEPAIEAVAATSKLPASGSVSGVWLERTGQANAWRAYEYAVDAAFVEALGLRLLAGRMLTDADGAATMVTNAAGVRALGFASVDEAVGQQVDVGGAPLRIIGVVDDYHFDLLDAPVRPLVLRYRPAHFRYATVRVRTDQADRALAQLEATWARFAPPDRFSYTWFDDQLENTMLNIVFRDVARVVGAAAGLAVVLVCLGLLGMAAYTVERRRREISVRRVLGASLSSIVLLLSRDFATLVGLALVVGVPLAWLLNQAWLQTFAYRTTFGPVLLGLSVGGLLVLALAVVSSQTLRAALSNPVKGLRQE